ncbi:anaerobic ribonucleoside-triphosphate reductase activating protein [Anaerobranca californiensis DSM 14826]|jgi:anaerobic ribonucleoside-triphosphate reductase activating protein|uniref:Anaerobic ribonucleoside-triphosphate reductase-activating protein n=1 Tax=Anaerobranca californiensis DSM 14826 TaxID=1120989 RepID=A0A1M6R520_9FIRM|nr:anaerobic ribonucleoside-triphosphate reductase activating protein [Anaerobranca californiensis]SHK27427.1 anaerobic ribonucleoside-triphosphate reductase activating protein [Anaerobranca californiensis DSM 14826]
MMIRIAGIIPESVVDGPGGISYTIFAQGCLHNCPGCHNPGTHSLDGGQEIDCSFILDDIKKYPLSKIVTFSGGEPFLQSEGFSYLAQHFKKNGYKIVVYTGFLYEDLIKDRNKFQLLKEIDLLIDGPYIEKLKDIDLPFRGSKNQRIINVPKSLLEGKVCLEEIN